MFTRARQYQVMSRLRLMSSSQSAMTCGQFIVMVSSQKSKPGKPCSFASISTSSTKRLGLRRRSLVSASAQKTHALGQPRLDMTPMERMSVPSMGRVYLERS